MNAQNENFTGDFDPQALDIIRKKIEVLRTRLLDSSRRNPLIQVPIRAGSTGIIRFVDELPDDLAERLAARQPMRLAPLPALDEDMPDEETEAFLAAIDLARRTDEEYLGKLEEVDPAAEDVADQERALERDLKDRVRAALGLPERQTGKNVSLAEHARTHGIAPDYILPRPEDRNGDGRHDDDEIQTLLLPEALHRTGRLLQGRGQAFERETGVNVIHVAFGILDWNEPSATRKLASSPLLLLEIRMERTKTPTGAEYRICGEGEIEVNTTLAQYLSSEFGLNLPAFSGTSVETYLEAIAALAPPSWHWKVRREALLGVFPSSRIAMYRDLDPKRRPIAENPLVASLLGSVSGGASSYAEPYETDAPEIEACVPHLVLDADSSQYSALVDVAKGRNMAIEGPPGSGKSQTIVNMIAAAMAAGRKVLFVAEKLTALDVVRNRLDSTGLGDFVLPLQAGKGSRDAVFQSLEDRLELDAKGREAARSHKARREALAARRAEMQAYLDMLGDTVGTSGLTVHEVLGQGIAHNDHLSKLSRDLRRLRLCRAEHMDADARQAFLADIDALAERLASQPEIAALWREARTAPVRLEDAEDIAADLVDLLDAISDLRAGARAPFLPGDILEAEAPAITGALERLAGAGAGADPETVARLLDVRTRHDAGCLATALARREEAIEELPGILVGTDAADLENRLETAGEFCEARGGAIDLAALESELDRTETALAQLTDQVELARALPAGWADREEARLADLRTDAEMLLRAPDAVLARRLPDAEGILPARVREIAERHATLASELGTLRGEIAGAGGHATEEIERVADVIEGAGFLARFGGRYREALSFWRDDLGGPVKQGRALVVARLRGYARWTKRRDAFAGDIRFTGTLGTAFAGMETDLRLIDELARFHETASRIAGDDARLRYALETGPLDAIRAFAAARELPPTSLAACETEIRIFTDVAKGARETLAEGRRHAALFRQAARIDGDLVERAIRLVGQRRSAEGTIADLGMGWVEGLGADGVRRAVDLAEAAVALPDPRAGIELLATGGAAAALDRARDIFATRDRLAGWAGGLARRLDLDLDGAPLGELARRDSRIRAAAENPRGLTDQARILRITSKIRARGLGPLVDAAESPAGRARLGELPGIARAILARSLSDHVEEVHGAALADHDGDELNRLRSEIAAIDEEMKDLSRRAIRDGLVLSSTPPEGNGKGKVGTYTGMCLVRHEKSKTRNRISARALTARAGQALLELKPCWMMSPLAVAQYLHDDLVFDLVIIDEASQMTPENALGALVRARQVVVVGDTKQMPPSSFFQKVLGDDEEDEDARTDSESILDMANASFQPVRQLSWHYRSRHPSLIAFSNRMVYDDKLTVFPAARESDPELGVSLVEVAGTYVKRRNVDEARAIVAGAIRHMRERPDLSLGLVTMNRDQSDLIQDEFERERERHPHVEAYLQDWAGQEDGLEEFFVKNLETVQGDERDVIMISTLYGPETAGGRTPQRFGPVTGPLGHRRLNVLFSRAKRQIVTYTSMTPSDIRAEGKSYGVGMLRCWLEFSKTGHLSEIETERSETESPFEDHVIAQVEAAGFEAVPQVGSARYRIDIGVRHPDWPYGYILAVECDGASYHSSRSSRDRDRLRQQVLEGLGWHFHRIWSTDWFRDPKPEIARLRAALQDALERVQAEEAASDLRRREARAARDAEMRRLAREAERAAQQAEPQFALPLEVPRGTRRA